MAITKLRHLKESKGTPSRSLKNCLNYIMDPGKTRHGTLVGGNAGITADEAYNNMMETKHYFDKLEGRQGYHFIISFAPGEADAETAMNIAMEFCDSYLRDYESCYSVHEDKAHLHIHICFNSIDMVEGKKYHYENGQWKHDIQPIVDQICIRHGLKPLVYDQNKPAHRKSYDKWEAGKQKPMVYENRKDIDAAIALAKDYDHFLRLLGQKYQIREGFSRKWNSEYFSMKGPGMEKSRRNYSLGKLYTVESIKSRITLKAEKSPVPLPVWTPEHSIRLQIDTIYKAPWKRKPRINKQAGYYMSFYWRMKNAMKVYVQKNGRATMELNRMVEMLEFSLLNEIHTKEDIQSRQLAWQLQLKAIQQEVQDLDIQESEREKASEEKHDNPADYLLKRQRLQNQAKQMKKNLAKLKKLQVEE